MIIRVTKRKLMVCDDGAVRTDHDAKVYRVGLHPGYIREDGGRILPREKEINE